MVVFEVRVGDQPVVAVRPVRAVHVLDRGQRTGGQTQNETKGDRAKCGHYRSMLRDRLQRGN
jgi:hypothetical protein